MSGQRGSAALLAVLGSLLLMGLALVVIVVATDYADASGRAVTAADAAALAAGSASPLAGGDDDPHDRAEALASANDAEVLGVDAAGWPRQVTVDVAVVPRVAAVRTILPAVQATATAAVRPGAPIDPTDLGAHSPPVARAAGSLTRPAAGRVSSPFGWRTHPVHGGRRLHAGLDIAAPTGAPIRAAAPGIVVAAHRRGGYGLLVEIDHGGGLRTRYAHASRLHVSPGQRVTDGEVIAAVGATGTATGPHLHFEVREHGRPVDPAPRLGLRRPTPAGRHRRAGRRPAAGPARDLPLR